MESYPGNSSQNPYENFLVEARRGLPVQVGLLMLYVYARIREDALSSGHQSYTQVGGAQKTSTFGYLPFISKWNLHDDVWNDSLESFSRGSIPVGRGWWLCKHPRVIGRLRLQPEKGNEEITIIQDPII